MVLEALVLETLVLEASALETSVLEIPVLETLCLKPRCLKPRCLKHTGVSLGPMGPGPKNQSRRLPFQDHHFGNRKKKMRSIVTSKMPRLSCRYLSPEAPLCKNGFVAASPDRRVRESTLGKREGGNSDRAPTVDKTHSTRQGPLWRMTKQKRPLSNNT